jgi:hypothetical protein
VNFRILYFKKIPSQERIERTALRGAGTPFRSTALICTTHSWITPRNSTFIGVRHNSSRPFIFLSSQQHIIIVVDSHQLFSISLYDVSVVSASVLHPSSKKRRQHYRSKMTTDMLYVLLVLLALCVPRDNADAFLHTANTISRKTSPATITVDGVIRHFQRKKHQYHHHHHHQRLLRLPLVS